LVPDVKLLIVRRSIVGIVRETEVATVQVSVPVAVELMVQVWAPAEAPVMATRPATTAILRNMRKTPGMGELRRYANILSIFLTIECVQQCSGPPIDN
jgi:hypothetical protein